MITRTNKTPIMHRSVEHNGAVYFGGVIADDLTASMYGQTADVTRKLDGYLADAGIDKSRVLAATLYLTDLNQKAEMNRAWNEWLASENLPARATLGVADLGPNVLIEVVITAAR